MTTVKDFSDNSSAAEEFFSHQFTTLRKFYAPLVKMALQLFSLDNSLAIELLKAARIVWVRLFEIFFFAEVCDPVSFKQDSRNQSRKLEWHWIIPADAPKHSDMNQGSPAFHIKGESLYLLVLILFFSFVYGCWLNRFSIQQFGLKEDGECLYLPLLCTLTGNVTSTWEMGATEPDQTPQQQTTSQLLDNMIGVSFFSFFFSPSSP